MSNREGSASTLCQHLKKYRMLKNNLLDELYNLSAGCYNILLKFNQKLIVAKIVNF